MRASKLQKWWIITRVIAIVLYYSFKVLFAALASKHPRKKIDKMTRDWSRKLLNTVKATHTVHNPFNVVLQPNHNYIMMSNHCSHFDIPLIFMTFPHGSIRMVAKKELFKVPIWGAAMKKGEFIAIDRENRQQALQDLQLAREKMRSGVILWIAPEGTRSRDGELQAFKKGGFMLALQTGATIIPINIQGSGKILPPKALNFRLGEHIDIHIAKPIDTSSYTIKDMKTLMVEVKKEILNFEL